MISVTKYRKLIEDTISESIDSKYPIYRDFAPNGANVGVICNLTSISNVERIIDSGNAEVFNLNVELNIFAFESRTKCDEVTDLICNALDCKSNQDFNLITVDNVNFLDFNPDMGFWGATVTLNMRVTYE